MDSHSLWFSGLKVEYLHCGGVQHLSSAPSWGSLERVDAIWVFQMGSPLFGHALLVFVETCRDGKACFSEPNEGMVRQSI